MKQSKGVVLITGAAKRIGRAVALKLAGDGWHVGVHYHSSKDDAYQLVQAIAALDGKAAALPADLSDFDETLRLVPACAEALGPPVCLINNASIYLRDDFANFDQQSWQRHIDINLRAPLLLSRAFAKALPSDENGNIINIIDYRVCRLTPRFFSYTISKAGLWAATRMLAQALAPRIRVNAIGPGPVLPNIYQTGAEFAEEWRATPLRRGARPEEIASAVGYILSAPAMTGQMIMLDGGLHLA